MYDVILRNGTVIDGTGAAAYRADVALKGGQIAAICDLGAEDATTEISVEGLVVAPGFIDSHSHSDMALLSRPTADSKVMQGVTTEVVGNCGVSAAPVTEKAGQNLLDALSDAGVEDTQWESLAEYNQVLEKVGVSLNVVPLVGHGTLRAGVMGYEAREARDDELEEMKALLAEALEQGAFGLSSGLIYAPGSYAPTDELIELARVVGRVGGLYTTHLRSEADELEAAVDEALRIGEAGNVPVLISHHKAGGRRNWGKINKTLARMAAQRARGYAVACDVYPYLAGSTSLPAILPGWVHEGGTRRLLERLRVPELRERIKSEFETGLPGWENLAGLAGWDNIMITNAVAEGNREVPGKTVDQVAEMRGVHPADAAFDLILEEKGSVGMVLFMMDEADMRRVLTSPWTMVGSDSGIRHAEDNSGTRPHPRAFGTFPRVLGHYVRDEQLLSLEEAVHKMTALPASYFGLASRGKLAVGHVADVTVFDPATIADRATYIAPNQYPTGISHVFVSGTQVVSEGRHTGNRTGRVLRRKGH